MQYHGCDQSRKLLSHYRRCRSLRARQVQGNRSSGSSVHHCLVCSLVSRQARTMLERGSSSPLSGSRPCIRKFASVKKPPVMSIVVAAGQTEPSSLLKMPPPPPRIMDLSTTPPSSSSNNLDMLTRLYETAKHLEDDKKNPAEPRQRAVSDADTMRTSGSITYLQRARSLSCGTAPTSHRNRSSPPQNCDTIEEEEVFVDSSNTPDLEELDYHPPYSG